MFFIPKGKHSINLSRIVMPKKKQTHTVNGADSPP
jgi:hypothetical protein